MADVKKRINSKAKGNEFELKTAKVLSKWWGEDFHRTPQSGGLHWKKDNRISGDIVTPPDSVFPFNIECKKREEWTFEQLLKGTGDLEKYWKQCLDDADSTDMKPMLIFSKNFAPNYLMISESDFHGLTVGSMVQFNYFLVHKVNQPARVVCVLEDFIAHVPKEHVIKSFNLVK
jgi:hypothetical protein